jgi:hypothetical protein
MKYFLFVIMYLLVISVYGSAQRRIIPFKNVYENYPDTIQSNLSFDDTWMRLIAFMQKNNFTGRIIDKSTGIITMQLQDAKITTENKKGVIDTSAWAIVQRIYSVPRNQYYYLKQSTVVWNLRITKTEDKTMIIIDSLNLLDAVKIYTYNIVTDQDNAKQYHTMYFPTQKFGELIKQNLE